MASKSAEEIAGLRCPRCKTRTRVRCTAPHKNGTVIRYRYCPVCPYHIKTTEAPVSQNGKPK